MLTKRIIPCLDVKDGRTVKGINFKQLRDAGDPVLLAKQYALEGADELVFLDISATEEKRKTMVKWVTKVAQTLNIPFTVGGGISSVEDAWAILRAGADKIAVNSAAVRRPELIRELSDRFGAQCVVVAIDAKPQNTDFWKVYISGGKKPTNLELVSWAKRVEQLGAGEILFTSMANDGTKDGFACAALQQVAQAVNIPVIASGGAGKIAHFQEVFKQTNVDAALAASVFHFGEIQIPELKKILQQQSIPIRL